MSITTGALDCSTPVGGSLMDVMPVSRESALPDASSLRLASAASSTRIIVSRSFDSISFQNQLGPQDALHALCSTVSTIPMIAESIAAPGLPVVLVEADHPSRTTTTVSPTPASTESRASKSSPPSEPSGLIGRTTIILLFSYRGSFWVATTLPITRASIINWMLNHQGRRRNRFRAGQLRSFTFLHSFVSRETLSQLYQLSCNRTALERAEMEKKLPGRDTKRLPHLCPRQPNQSQPSADLCC